MVRTSAGEDPGVAQALLENFTSEGIEVLLETRVRQVEGLSGQEIRIRAENSRGEHIIQGTDLLVVTGRTPNTQGIGLDAAGVEVDTRGFIKVSDRLETTATAVGQWAIAPAARSSPTLPSTIFGWSATT